MKKIIASSELFGVPDEFRVFPCGIIKLHMYGTVSLDRNGMDAIISDFERRGNDMVVDYEHQTLKAVQAPAAGWIKRLYNRGSDGLWAAVEWTQRARAYLASREYRYFSPFFLARKADGHIINLINVALTNMPKMNHIRPIVAKAGIATGDDTAQHSGVTPELLHVCRLMGTSVDDVIKYGLSGAEDRTGVDTAQHSGVTPELLHVCRLMGTSLDDVIKYGFGGVENQ